MLTAFKKWLITILTDKDNHTTTDIGNTSVESAKVIATKNKEPYIDIITLTIDPKNPAIGSFELDWNEYFILDLRRNGYQGKTDEDVVDNWFREICKNILNETWEQEQAMNPEKSENNVRYINRQMADNGRTEFF